MWHFKDRCSAKYSYLAFVPRHQKKYNRSVKENPLLIKAVTVKQRLRHQAHSIKRPFLSNFYTPANFAEKPESLPI